MMNQTNSVYEFAGYRVDPVERLLTRYGDPIHLPPKVFETLIVLVENPGKLVAKDEFITRIWPDTFVEESTLARNISDLRKALGHAPDSPKFIETVPKHGYRFVAAVRASSSAAENIVIELHRSSRIVSEETESAVELAPSEIAPMNGCLIPSTSPDLKKPLATRLVWIALGAVIVTAVVTSIFGRRAAGLPQRPSAA